MTLLFEGLHHTKDEQSLFATKGLANLGGEQAGFIDINNGILQMAGGEFCINATRSLGLLMALDAQGDAEVDSLYFEGVIKTSGFTDPLAVAVKQEGENINVTLSVPLISLPPIEELDLGIYLVRLAGISHVLIHEKYNDFCEQNWAQSSAHIRQKYKLEDEGAVGCMWWRELQAQEDGKKTIKHIYMHPIVWVKNPHALHYENACGSGSLALAIWHYVHAGHGAFVIHQPGGHLTLDLQQDIQGLKGVVGGPVYMVAKGTAYFSSQ